MLEHAVKEAKEKAGLLAKACYLLYLDGSRKIYDKGRSTNIWAGQKHIFLSITS